MEQQNLNSPKIIKTAALVFVISALFIFIYLAQSILLPIILGLFFSILLLPLVHFFNQRFRFKDIFSIITAILLSVIFLVGLIYFFSKEIGYVLNDLPEISKNLHIHYATIQNWVKETFNISYDSQSSFLSNNISASKLISPSSVQSIGGLTDLLINLILIPIYTLLILIYRKNFISFLHQITKKSSQRITTEILAEINQVLRQYLMGLGIEMLVVAILMTFGLWIIGFKYFLFIGILTALLNLVPYIGIVIACSISILLVLVGNSDLTLITGVLIVNAAVQFIDNNILIPKIVGSKVRINAFASIIAVIVGGMIGGVGGMFLALPILATLKVIFDHVDHLKPYGFLIGEND